MYAVLHPPNFAAQVAAQQRPELRKRAFALVDGEPPAEIVVAANKAARSCGIEAGMSRLQSETFPGVTILRRVQEDELTAQAILHTIACMFSPRIEYVESYAGTYALDIRGMNGLFGSIAIPTGHIEADARAFVLERHGSNPAPHRGIGAGVHAWQTGIIQGWYSFWREAGIWIRRQFGCG